MSKIKPDMTNYVSAKNTFAKDDGMHGHTRRNGFDGSMDGVKYIAKYYIDINKLEGSTYLLNATGALLNWIYQTAVYIRTEVAPSRWPVFIFEGYLTSVNYDLLDVERSETTVGIREAMSVMDIQMRKKNSRITPWNTEDEDLMYISRLIIDKVINDIYIMKQDPTKVA